MANPQVENGYTKINNENFDMLCQLRLGGYEWNVLMYIIRKTWGWKKKSDMIPLSQISEGTGLPKSHASRAVMALASRSIVTKNGNSHIGFNKDWEQWQFQKLPKMVTPEAKENNHDGKLPKMVTEEKDSVTKNGNGLHVQKLPKMAPQKKGKKEVYREIVIIGGEIIGVNDFWDRCLEVLKTKVAGSNFNTWLANTSGVGFQEDAFILGVPSVFVSEEITKRFDPIITKTLSEAVGRRMELICEVV